MMGTMLVRLVVDGELKYAVSEERYSRLKHHYGFPKKVTNKFYLLQN